MPDFPFHDPGTTLLHNCHVVDSTATQARRDVAVLIEGDRITAVGALHEIEVPDGAERIDLGGRYLSPGLINMHTHLGLSLPGAMAAEVKAMTPVELALYMTSNAQKTLLSGVTTIRSVGEKLANDFALRAAINRGRLTGPRIFTAGRPVASTGGHGHATSGSIECDGADGFRHGVRSQIREGADFIKLMISGGISGQHEKISTRQVTRDELSAAIGTAHDWGRKTTAHAGSAEIIGEAVGLGLDCVEHGYQLTKEVTDAMAANDCWYVPTLVVTRCKEFFDEFDVPEWMQQRSLGAGDRHLQSYRWALESGVTVMLGSDMPPWWTFDGTNAAVRELEHMSAEGLGAARALAAATSLPAEWLGLDGDLGTVEGGKFADLIAMDGNPLEETHAYRGIDWVMKGGEIVRDDRGSRVRWGA